MLVNGRCNHSPIYLMGEIHGGSVYSPTHNMHHYFLLESKVAYKKAPYITFFPIKNRGVPNTKIFINHLDKALGLLYEGKKIWIGCLGGHGRTGLFITCLYYALTSDRNSLYIVRDLYCSRAVESYAQYVFLEEFGIYVRPTDKKKDLSSPFSWRNKNEK